MASLVIVAAILIAVKSPDWIEQYKQHKAKQANDKPATLTEEYFAPSADEHETLSASGKLSKREILTRRYWHERRELSRNSRDHVRERSGSGESEVPPPPYIGPPMYQELEKSGGFRSENEHPNCRGLPAPEYSR
ncbi:hypothetical protein BJY01DRAFT_47526 [Aspergillus pseudoustus]|uniref:Uncharacterized protein n=1 Tax=Aspergillus pseudoustus TaxID=1810923 RepID=A0ABR4JAP2_9EURO